MVVCRRNTNSQWPGLCASLGNEQRLGIFEFPIIPISRFLIISFGVHHPFSSTKTKTKNKIKTKTKTKKLRLLKLKTPQGMILISLKSSPPFGSFDNALLNQ